MATDADTFTATKLKLDENSPAVSFLALAALVKQQTATILASQAELGSAIAQVDARGQETLDMARDASQSARRCPTTSKVRELLGLKRGGGSCGCGGGTGAAKKTTKPPTTKKTTKPSTTKKTTKKPPYSHKRNHATYGQITDFTQRYGISPPSSWGGRKTQSKTHRTKRRRTRMS